MCVEVADSAPADFLDTYSKLLDIQIYYYSLCQKGPDESYFLDRRILLALSIV